MAEMSDVELARTRLLNWIDEVSAGTYEVPAKSPGFVRDFEAAVRAEALEGAAKACEGVRLRLPMFACDDNFAGGVKFAKIACAEAVRALKEKPDGMGI